MKMLPAKYAKDTKQKTGIFRVLSRMFRGKSDLFVSVSLEIEFDHDIITN